MALGPDVAAERVAEFAKACRQNGLKATHQRMEVFRELASTDEHPDADTVLRRVRSRVPSVSKDTVYRTLHALEKAGFLSTVAVPSGPARFDANAERHDHFVCTECGLVRDFVDPRMDAYSAPARVRAWGRVYRARVEVRGVCAACVRKGRGTGRRR